MLLDLSQSACYTTAMAKETKSAQVLIRLQPSLKAMAEKAAAEDQRSLSSMIEKLVTEHLRKNGYLKGAKK